MIRLLAFSIVLFLVSSVVSLGQQPSISFSEGALQLAGGQQKAALILSSNDYWGVLRAGNDLAVDFGLVTGTNLVIYNASDPSTNTTSTFKGPAIIAGTIGKSALIDSLIAARMIDVSEINGTWESFQSQIVANPLVGLASALVIAGSDKRGTIYGLYDISEQIGVSPWYYWADVSAASNSEIYALDIIKVQGEPSVKYRGIFLNDEQPCLTGWVNDNFANPGYVSGFYTRVFELLLRLRANYLWPAMWNSMFCVDDPLNQPLADKYGIVMGTSHTEPLMRSTKEQSTYLTGAWDWSTNKVNIITFLTEGAKRAQPYESLFSMGMRGSGDTASPSLDAASLTDVINSEQSILQDVFGITNLSVVPQMWCLYKEVGGYYEDGMTVPEDITLLWPDDNSGNLERLPTPAETKRSGGAGIYYHFDYVGSPRDYKWINTISLAKTWEQMHLTYENGADRIWIVNVGDLKPLEIPINHFLDMAYDMTRFTTADSTKNWLSLWADREFGSLFAADVASIVAQYSQYTARRKYELIDPTTYSLVNYNEADTILAQWDALVKNATVLYDAMPEAMQPAFFEMVLHPCTAGYIVHQVYINAAYNSLYQSQGRVSTLYTGEATISAFTQDAALSASYNGMLDGKWNHFMDQVHMGYTTWSDPLQNIMPSIYFPAESTKLEAPPGVALEAGSTSLELPPMDPYGPATRWIDIYSKCNSTSNWNATSDPWIILTPSSGILSAPGPSSDQRVLISIDWTSTPNGTSTSKILITTGSSTYTITVPLSYTTVPSTFSGFIESDKTISIEVEHYSSASTSSIASYVTIPNYGRTLSGITLLPTTISPLDPASPSSPKVTYNLYLFTSTTASITTYLGPSLNFNPSFPLQYAVSIDDAAPTTCQYVPVTTLGTLPDAWTDAVENTGWSYTTEHEVGIGEHVLNLWALGPGVVFQKVVVDLGGVRGSYLGPPESVRV